MFWNSRPLPRLLVPQALSIALAAQALCAQDAPPPVLSGIVLNVPTIRGLVVDGRTILTAPKTEYACATSTAGPAKNFVIKAGVPQFAIGSRVAIYGKWNEKASAYLASQICLTKEPADSADGAAPIDTVAPLPGGEMELVADGRTMLLRASLTTGAKPEPGAWIEYKASRQSTGPWQIETAAVTNASRFGREAKVLAWKPLELVPPANGQDGKLKLAHLQGTFKLVGDQMMEDRVARVGASVVPAWQKAMPNTNPRKIDYQFYVVEKTSVNDCYSIPNGTVLVPKKILTALPEDSDLAAVVAGCVAEVTVDQALHFYSRLTTASALSVGAVAVGVLIPGVGLAALAGGGYNEHEISLAEEQAARIAMTYLQMSGYPATAGATAWEKLEGKHDQMQPGQQPGRRARLEYEAQGEVGAPLSPSAGDVPPNAVPSSH